MEVILGKNLSLLRVAKGGDKVYKDECVYCFNSPVSFIVQLCAMSDKFGVVPGVQRRNLCQPHLFHRSMQEPYSATLLENL